MRRLEIFHRTHYAFAGMVQLQPHRLLLRPREGHDLRIEAAQLTTTPSATLRWVRDVYDNSVCIASFSTPTTQLLIESKVTVQQYDEAPLDFLVEDHAVNYPFTYKDENWPVLQPYQMLQQRSSDGALWNWLQSYWSAGQTLQTYTLLERLCTGIRRSFTYVRREEPGVQSAAETLARGAGSCRDFANLFMEAARLLGLAARFVSGYLDTPNSAADFGATHAWTEVYLPGAGWKGFDPTLGEVAGSKHIAVAVARLPEVVSPVSGSFFGPVGAILGVGVWVTEL